MNGIELFFNSLPDEIEVIDVRNSFLTYLPSLTRFKNLIVLLCENNQLTFLPDLPENLVELRCSNNQLTFLPDLPENLVELWCSNNQLIFLPDFPVNLRHLSCPNNILTVLPSFSEKLEVLDCSCNKLTFLPKMSEKLKFLFCHSNRLTSLPCLNENLDFCMYYGNPIYEIFLECENKPDLLILKIPILNKFRYLFFSLKFKEKFRQWRIKTMEVKIMEKYHPKYLEENLNEDTDLDEFLEKW